MNAKQARLISKKLLKVAQDELDVTKQIAPVEGQAGPQEVIDAVAEIASDITEVMSMIPAEPSQPGGVDIDDAELGAEVPEPSSEVPAVPDAPPAPAAVPEEDEDKKDMLAQIAELKGKINTNEKDVIANKIAELYGGSEDKYNEIMDSNKSASYHAAQLETLENFVEANVSSKPKIAQEFSSYIKVAQQLGKKGNSKRKML